MNNLNYTFWLGEEGEMAEKEQALGARIKENKPQYFELGPEPTLEEMILHYYVSHGIPNAKYWKDKYIEAWVDLDS